MAEIIRADVIERLRGLDLGNLTSDEISFFRHVRPCEWNLYFALLRARLQERLDALDLARRLVELAIADTPAMHTHGNHDPGEALCDPDSPGED